MLTETCFKLISIIILVVGVQLISLGVSGAVALADNHSDADTAPKADNSADDRSHDDTATNLIANPPADSQKSQDESLSVKQNEYHPPVTDCPIATMGSGTR